MSSETTFHSGTEFLGYRLEQLIGQGGMGVVYRAYDRRLKRTVAVKFITPELALDERFRERFLRETELAAAFEHPNAVPIHDAGDVDGRLYLAMRYVEGSDLAVLLRSAGPLDPARAVRICAQVARALDAAHASGLVHRDVKPSNVLLDAGEHVYVADFGLTRRLVDEGGPLLDGRSLGTPAYLAPEQLEGEPVDGRADLYSLACLLYECLTGEPPFRHDSRLAVAWAHLEQEPPSASARNAALPAAVDEPLRTALAKDPADRQPTCAALIAATETALGLGAPRRSRRRTLLVAAGAAVLAGLAAVVTALIAGSGSNGGPAGPLYGEPNSVIRIDPERNAVADVVPLGRRGEDPEAVAVHGRRVWVYSYAAGDTVSSFDASTKHVQTVGVPVQPVDVSSYAGPVLAADAGGAWLIGLIWGSTAPPSGSRPDHRHGSSQGSIGFRSIACPTGWRSDTAPSGSSRTARTANGTRSCCASIPLPGRSRTARGSQEPPPSTASRSASATFGSSAPPARRSTAWTHAPASGAGGGWWTPVAPARPVRP